MANRQTTPRPGLAGAMAKRGVNARPVTPTAVRHIAGNGTLAAAQTLVEAGENLAEETARDKEDKMKLEAAASLKAYRRAMQGAGSQDELDTLAKESEKALKSQFAATPEGKSFWQKHGDSILTAARTDSGRIKAEKQADFGRSTLEAFLADSQNLLADTDNAAQGGNLLKAGADKIAATPFLSPEQKQTYRDGYLKTGILNLALHTPEAADAAAQQYFAGDETLARKIAETGRLSRGDREFAEQRQARQNGIAAFGKASSLWQKHERGEISDAEYFVLTDGNDGDLLWSEREDRSSAPLFAAYQAIRQMNGGAELSAEEVRDAGNNLASAYYRGEIGLDEAAALQDQLVLAQSDPAAAKLFDTAADEAIDRAFMRDVPLKTGMDAAAQAMMESKAKLAFGIYQDYYARKTALVDDYTAQGGAMTPLAAKRIAKQALDESLAASGLKTAGEAAGFGELRRTLRQVYSGGDEQRVWQKFAAVAPYSEDKHNAMRQVAAEEQRRELALPRFETYDEVAEAGLEPGDRFYFRGRLAVKRG